MAYTNQQKRILLVMSSNDEIGISGKLDWYVVPRAGRAVLHPHRERLRSRIGLAEGRRSANRSAQHEVALYQRIHRPLSQ